jgi:cytochrome c556
MAALLALGLWSLAAHSADDDDEEDKQAIMDAQKAVKQLVESINKKGDVKAQLQAIRKKHELKNLMWVYKPAKKGGIGMGKDGSSIETELAKLGGPKTRLTNPKVKAMRADLIKIGEISRAIAEITEMYPPKKKAAQWKQYTKDMRKGAEELIQAAKSGDKDRVKKAANNLSSSCTDCHADFRND